MGMEYKLLFETMIIIKLFPKVISSHKVQALSPSTHTHTHVWNKISWLKRRDRKRDPSGPTLLALPFPTYMLQFALGVAVNFLRYIFLPLLAVQLRSFAVKVTPYLQKNAKFSPWGRDDEWKMCSKTVYSTQKWLLWNWALDLLFFFKHECLSSPRSCLWQ